MIKAVIFDADGVLNNAERFSLQLEREYNISLETTSSFFKLTFQDCLVGKADLKIELEKVLHKWNWKGTVEEFLIYWFKSGHQVDEELINYVRKIKQLGIKCLVATNNESYRTEYMIEHMGFGETFDQVYGSGHIGYKKPDSKFFQSIINDQNVLPDEILFWDDDEENVQAARDLRIQAEVYRSIEEFKNTMRAKYQIKLD